MKILPRLDLRLEAEPDLQIEAAIGRRRGEEPASQRRVLPKPRRTHDPNGSGVVHTVEQVPRPHHEGDLVLAVGAAAEAKTATATATTQSTRPQSAVARSTATAAAPTETAAAALFRAKADGLAQRQVGAEFARTGAVVDRNQGFAGNRIGVEVAI